MPVQTARNQFVFRLAGVALPLVCALAGAVVYHFFGNATQGYIHSRSLFVWWGSQWFESAAETQHGPLILLAAAWLFRRNLRIHSGPTTPAGGAALAAMLAGLALHLAGYALQQTRISIAGFLVFVWGVLVLAGGRRWGRAAGFPLAFMLLAVPVSFVDTLGFYLRLAVTNQAFVLAQLFGVKLLRNGTQLFSPDGHFQYDVAAACSGIRSLVALLALALLIGYLNFRSWWARLVLVITGLPYVVIGNIGRVLVVVLIGERSGQAAGERLHAWAGALVFLAVVVLLLVTVPLLQRLGFKSAETVVEVEPMPEHRTRIQPWLVTTLTVVASLAVCLVAARFDARPPGSVAGVRLQDNGVTPVALPEFVGTEWIGRRVDVTAEERAVLPADTGYSRRNYVSISDVRRQVFVSVVLSGRDRTSIHRPELCLVGQGWTIAGRDRQEFLVNGEAVPATLLRIEHAVRGSQTGAAPVQSLFAYWFVGGDALEPTHAGMQWRDACDRVRYLRSDRWAYVVVQTRILQGNEAEALGRMQEVLAGVWPTIRVGQPPLK